MYSLKTFVEKSFDQSSLKLGVSDGHPTEEVAFVEGFDNGQGGVGVPADHELHRHVVQPCLHHLPHLGGVAPLGLNPHVEFIYTHILDLDPLFVFPLDSGVASEEALYFK